MSVGSLGLEDPLKQGMASQPTPIFLPGEFHGQQSLEGYSPQDHKELDMTEATQYARTHTLTGSSVQSLSHAQLFASSWTAAHQAVLSITDSWSLLKLMFIESVMPSNHLILCYPLFFCLQSLSASGSFLMSWLFTSGGQSTGASVSASVLLMNIQD